MCLTEKANFAGTRSGRNMEFIDIARAIACMAVFIEHITARFDMELRRKLYTWTGG